MSFFISILLFFAGLIKRNSKIAVILLFALLWVLFGWNTDNADYTNYVRGYSWAHGAFRFNSEVGFQLINKLFIFAGLEYKHLLIVLSFSGLLLIYKTIKLHTENAAFVLALFFLYPFIKDVVQIRNFLIMSMILYATQFIIFEQKRGTLKFVIIVLLTTTIHFSSIVYLLLLFSRQKNVNSVTIFSIFITLLGLLLVFTNIIQNIAGIFFPFEKVNHWFSTKFNYGVIIAVLIYAVNLFLIFYVYKKIKINTTIKNSKINKNLIFTIAVYKINIILLLLFPLYMFNMIFFRLYRNMFILNYIVYSIGLSYIKLKSIETIVFIFSIVLFLLSLTILQIIYPYYDTVFLPVFQNNSIIGQ